MRLIEQKQIVLKRLELHQKIASVKTPKHIEKAINPSLSCVFLLTGKLSLMKRFVELYKKYDIPVFLHLDKIGGVQSNAEGIEFVANYIQPTGIISTRTSLVQVARKHGLLTIQRLFLVDTDAVKKGIEEAKKYQPDFIEIMPALVPEIIRFIHSSLHIPIITGGLIHSSTQMFQSIESGAIAVSTSKPELWKVDMKKRDGSNSI